MASTDRNPVVMVSEQVESSTDSSMEDEDWTDEELETLTRAVAKLTYAMASWFDEERATEMIQDMRRIEANVASLIAEGKPAEIPTISREIDDLVVDSSSTDLLKSSNMKLIDDEEEALPTLEKSPKFIGDDLADPALAKQFISSTAQKDNQIVERECPDPVAPQVISDNQIVLQAFEVKQSMNNKVIEILEDLTRDSELLIDNTMDLDVADASIYKSKLDDHLRALCFDPGGVCLMVDSHGLREKSPRPRGDGPNLAKDLTNTDAHQVFDKMPKFLKKGTELSAALSKDIMLSKNVMCPNEEQGVLNFDPGGAGKVVSKLVNSIEDGAQPVFDPGIIDKRVDESILVTKKVSIRLKRFREDNSLIDRAKFVNLDLENVRVVTFGCIELLSFDPGGNLLMCDMVRPAIHLPRMNLGNLGDFGSLRFVDNIRELTSTETNRYDNMCAFVDPPILLIYASNSSKYDVLECWHLIGVTSICEMKEKVMELVKCLNPCCEVMIFVLRDTWILGDDQEDINYGAHYRILKHQLAPLILSNCKRAPPSPGIVPAELQQLGSMFEVLTHDASLLSRHQLLYEVVSLWVSSQVRAKCIESLTFEIEERWSIRNIRSEMQLPCSVQMNQMLQPTVVFLLILEDKDPSRREYCDRVAKQEKRKLPLVLICDVKGLSRSNIRFMVATGCPGLIISLPALLYHELIIMCKEGATSFVFDPGGDHSSDHPTTAAESKETLHVFVSKRTPLPSLFVAVFGANSRVRECDYKLRLMGKLHGVHQSAQVNPPAEPQEVWVLWDFYFRKLKPSCGERLEKLRVEEETRLVCQRLIVMLISTAMQDFWPRHALLIVWTRAIDATLFVFDPGGHVFMLSTLYSVFYLHYINSDDNRSRPLASISPVQSANKHRCFSYNP